MQQRDVAGKLDDMDAAREHNHENRQSSQEWNGYEQRACKHDASVHLDSAAPASRGSKGSCKFDERSHSKKGGTKGANNVRWCQSRRNGSHNECKTGQVIAEALCAFGGDVFTTARRLPASFLFGPPGTNWLATGADHTMTSFCEW